MVIEHFVTKLDLEEKLLGKRYELEVNAYGFELVAAVVAAVMIVVIVESWIVNPFLRWFDFLLVLVLVWFGPNTSRCLGDV